jgi:hypothetical protein
MANSNLTVAQAPTATLEGINGLPRCKITAGFNDEMLLATETFSPGAGFIV